MVLKYNPDDWTKEKIEALPIEEQDELAAARVRQNQRPVPYILIRRPDGSTTVGPGDARRRDRTSHMLVEVRGPSPAAPVVRRVESSGRRGR